MANNNVVGFPSSRTPFARRLVPSKLRDARTARRLNQSELAEIVGVSRQAISAFEQGEKSPDPETMARIAQTLRQPIAFFATADLSLFGDSSVRFYRAFGPETKRRNLACDVLGKWLAQVTRYLDQFVNFPEVKLPPVSPVASSGRYSDDEIEGAAEACRHLWGLGLGPISNVLLLLESKGIAQARFELPGEQVQAFSFWNGSRPFIFLASDKSSSVRARFDAAHELGHLVLHRWVGPEEIEDPKRLKEIEREANRFAGAFLLPRKTFPNEVYTPRVDAFIETKRRWKVAIQAMVYRCKDLGIFDEDQVTNIYKQISFKKWRTKEPLDDVIPIEQPRILCQAASIILESGRKRAEDFCADLALDANVIESLCNLKSGTLQRSPSPEFVPTLK